MKFLLAAVLHGHRVSRRAPSAASLGRVGVWLQALSSCRSPYFRFPICKMGIIPVTPQGQQRWHQTPDKVAMAGVSPCFCHVLFPLLLAWGCWQWACPEKLIHFSAICVRPSVLSSSLPCQLPPFFAASPVGALEIRCEITREGIGLACSRDLGWLLGETFQPS